MTPRSTFQRIRQPSPWRESLRLRDGRELLLRPIDPRDIEPIRASFALLHDEEVRLRYLHPVKALAEDYLQALVHPRRGRDFTLVLAEPLAPGEALVGAVARLVRDPDGGQAEFALLVSHFLAGQGLGRLLLRKLIARARRWRLRVLYGQVREDNTAMLALATALGFRYLASSEPATLRVQLDLLPQGAAPTPPAPVVAQGQDGTPR